MKRLVVTVCLAVCLQPAQAADSYERLVQEYTAARAAAARGKGNSNARARQVAPIARKIAALRTDRARAFLVRELDRPPAAFGKECARALAGSGDPRAVAVLLDDFGRRRPGTARAILDALEWAAKLGENRKEKQKKAASRAKGRKAAERNSTKAGTNRKNRAKAGTPLDLGPVETVLVRAARETRRPDLKARLVPLLGRLESVAAASTVLGLAEGDPSTAGADELRPAAVDALTGMGTSEAVRGWIAKAAFEQAADDAGQLMVVADVAGQLRLAAAARRLQRLLAHPSRPVGVAALVALSHLEKDISSQAVGLAYGWLKRERDPVLRARILDSLARGGERGVKVVLRVADANEAETRAIALGSLALEKERPAALERLLEGLRDRSRDVRSVALRAVRGVRTKEVISSLIQLLDRESEHRLRVDALKLLVDLTGHNMGLVAADWKKWWSYGEKSFVFPEERTSGSTAVKTADISYFGIEISSRKMAFLLDVSNSMLPYARSSKSGPKRMRKIDLLKRELSAVLGKLPAESFVNIHVFDRSVRSWEKRLQPLQGGGRERAIQYVQELTLAGGTNIFDSIELAMQDPAIDTIYLLTDGQPTTGRYSTPAGIVKGVRDLNRARAVTFHCIAFGGQSDLLRELAAENGGEYRFVNE